MTGLGAAAAFNLELGRGNPYKAKRTAGTAASVLVLCGVVLCVVIRVFLEPLMTAFGATDRILDYAMEYAGITSFGIPFFLFSTGINPLVRADGNSTYSMAAIITGAVLNTILDPIFIFVLHMGIAGAAWATVISQAVSAVLLLLYFPRFRTVHFSKEDFLPRPGLIRVIVSLGFTSFIFQLSTMIIQVATNNLLKTYGAASVYGTDIPIAVAGIVSKVNVIFTSVVLGVVQGSQPICGFNYGAEKYDRVRETVRLLLKTVFVISLFMFAVFELFPRQIISLFGDGDELYFAYAEKYMRIFLFFVFLNGIQIAITTFFPSIGKAFKGAVLSLSKQIVFLLPLLLILPRFFGIDGIMYATPVSDFIAFLIAARFLAAELRKMPR